MINNVESSEHDQKLWNLQFNRWWGWNWLRKRKKRLSKTYFKQYNSDNSIYCAVDCIKNGNAEKLFEKKSNLHGIKTVHLKPRVTFPICSCKMCPVKLMHTHVFKMRSVHVNHAPEHPPKRRSKCTYKRQDEFAGWVQNLPSCLAFLAPKTIPTCTAKCIATNHDFGYLILRMQYLKKAAESPGVFQLPLNL